RADMACGAYDERPRVCRIYPAESHPTLTLDPAAKACPPEAWSADRPVLMAEGRLVDAATAELIAQSREADQRDRLAKAYLCAQLGYDTAALANEGFAVYSPARDALRTALEAAQLAAAHSDGGAEPQSPYPWRYVTNRAATLATLQSIDAPAHLAQAAPHGEAPAYLGFFDADPA
ncbi:YkgJ family cysteine cluster protein, partial [Burkholderia sp. Ac-20379]|nr:YkgJ family cysteine cluster protein [Burkholderia sp. Ac-20379]